MVDCPAQRERFPRSPKRQTRAFGLVRGGGEANGGAVTSGGILDPPRHSLEAYRTMTGAYGDLSYGRILRPVAVSAKGISGAGDEDAGAAGLGPDALVARSGRTVVVVAWEELALVDPQLTVEEMQLFYARMSMCRVTRAPRKTYQHADPVPLRVGREQLAFDPGGDLLPFGFGPLP